MAETQSVMISSTGRDLGAYRQAAIEVCNQLGLRPIAMEFFEAMGQGATEASKRKLEEADVYVGIVAHRYGYVEDGYDRSVTEVEFDYAAERGLDRLCFVADPTHPWLPEAIDLNRQPIEAFKERLASAVVRRTFTTVDDFRAKLLHALIGWRQARQAAGPDDDVRAGAARCLEHLYNLQRALASDDQEMLSREIWFLGEQIGRYAEAIARAADPRVRNLHNGLLGRIRAVHARDFDELDELVAGVVAATA